ncbi:unnamed protein product [Peniophora sp. CBMAI 1063]|nr:unnamed protein product [Peniophora sp. CBMAI 1063]
MAPSASQVVKPKNDSLPMPGLPAETIANIFLYLSDASRQHLFKARAVSKGWMKFIDATPILWTPISTHLGSEMVSRAVERSGSLPLDVDIGIYPRRELSTPDATVADQISAAGVLEQLWRIRTLEVDLLDLEGVSTERAHHLLNENAAPILEQLRIVGTETDEMVPVALDQKFFGSSIPPLLRDLQITICAVSLHCPLLHASTLVSVRIDECRVWGSVEKVLDSLSSWPLLETFVWMSPEGGVDDWNDQFIGDFAITRMPKSEWKGVRVRLPRLKTLKLRHEPAPILTIFSRLHFPTSCDIDLTFFVETIETEKDEDRMRDALDHTLGAYLGNVFSDGEGFATIAVETPRDADALPYEPFHGVAITWTDPSSSPAPVGLKTTFYRNENSARCNELPLAEHLMKWPQTSSYLTGVNLGPMDFLYNHEEEQEYVRRTFDSDWHRLLALFKSIEYLCIRKDEGLSWLFQVLNRERSVLPQMKSLYLEETHVDELTTLVSMARRRMEEYSLSPNPRCTSLCGGAPSTSASWSLSWR